MTGGPLAPTRGAARPVDDVELGDGLFGRWQRRNREATIPHGLRELEASGVLDNLRRAIGRSDAEQRGPVFADSDVHKTLEAVAWELGHGEDPVLRAFYEDTIALLAEVQEDDGYLDSVFQGSVSQGARPADERWTDLTSAHELYCAGHLIQAAIASTRALDDDRLLAIATRLADLVVRRFGPGREGFCGHPEIEYALVELSRLTGREEYLATAQAILDRRGSGRMRFGPFGPSYFQDDVPVRDTTTMRGHAVRALYLANGAADVWLETGDPALGDALAAQWTDLATRRSYVTGGTGSRHRDEAFGDAYELPSDRAYSETCAGIALLHWAWRMLAATGEARFADLAETVLYNVIPGAVADDGAAFFYSNPLQLRRGRVTSQEEATAARLPWYWVACCPPNLMRTFASLGSYVAVTVGDELRIANPTRAMIRARLGAADAVVDVDTDYPRDGTVRIRMREGAGRVALRIPGWCRAVTVSVDGRTADSAHEDGWLRLGLAEGEEATVELGLTVDAIAPHPDADAIRGAAAIRRGPVVYCLEQSDNAEDVERMTLLPDARTAEETADATPLGPIVALDGVLREGGEPALYTRWDERPPAPERPVRIRMRPYATWGNAHPGNPMRVWVPARDTGV